MLVRARVCVWPKCTPRFDTMTHTPVSNTTLCYRRRKRRTEAAQRIQAMVRSRQRGRRLRVLIARATSKRALGTGNCSGPSQGTDSARGSGWRKVRGIRRIPGLVARKNSTAKAAVRTMTVKRMRKKFRLLNPFTRGTTRRQAATDIQVGALWPAPTCRVLMMSTLATY